MDFELSADQRALQDAARELLDREAAPARVRAIVDAAATGGPATAGSGGEPSFDTGLWRALVEQGWLAVAVPEELGGVGLGWVELAVLCEQAGAHTAPVPFLSQVLAIDALVRANRGDSTEPGAAARAADLLPGLIDGTTSGAVAWRPVEARRHGDDAWTLSGATVPAAGLPGAQLVVVPAVDVSDPSGDGVLVGDQSLFLVDLAAAGLASTGEPAMDLTRRVGRLTFADTPAIRLGGSDAVAAFVDAGAVGLSAELLGGAAAVMGQAVEYAKERKQFGQPIGSFQAVKHRCADMLVDVEGMRSAAYYAAWCLAADDPDRSVAASTAKSWCSDAALRVSTSALQVHGGIGFTWECDVHLYLKRAQLDAVSFGDATHHRARLAGLLRDRVLSGTPVI